MLYGMPVARRIDRKLLRCEALNIPVKYRHHLISMRNSKTATGQKIVLHVDDQQRVAGLGVNIILSRAIHGTYFIP